MPCTASCISENNVLLNSPNPIAATIARGNDDVCDTTHRQAQHIKIAPAITATLTFCVRAILSAGMEFTSHPCCHLRTHSTITESCGLVCSSAFTAASPRAGFVAGGSFFMAPQEKPRKRGTTHNHHKR